MGHANCRRRGGLDWMCNFTSLLGGGAKQDFAGCSGEMSIFPPRADANPTMQRAWFRFPLFFLLFLSAVVFFFFFVSRLRRLG